MIPDEFQTFAGQSDIQRSEAIRMLADIGPTVPCRASRLPEHFRSLQDAHIQLGGIQHEIDTFLVLLLVGIKRDRRGRTAALSYVQPVDRVRRDSRPCRSGYQGHSAVEQAFKAVRLLD